MIISAVISLSLYIVLYIGVVRAVSSYDDYGIRNKEEPDQSAAI